MNDDLDASGTHAVARVKRVSAAAWVWLIPLGAIALVAYLAYTYWLNRGPLVTVTFQTADGLSAQRTPVKYRAVRLGIVETVTLAEDRSKVVAEIRMDERARSMLTDETRFWVVRPRLSGDLSTVTTGLKALVSGAYVAMDPGTEKGRGTPKKHFEGLPQPPNVRSDQPGTAYYLTANSLGSLGTGSPLFFRDIKVGRVLSYELLQSGDRVRVRAFVEAPYDAYIVDGTRFWKSSGVQVKTGAEGLEVEFESLRSLIGGGIAFRSPPQLRGAPPAAAETTFQLHEDQSTAELTFYDESIPYVTYFKTSVQGLTEGSDVLMYGEKLGSVTEVALALDPNPDREGEFAARVAFVVQPGRVLSGSDREGLRPTGIRSLSGKHLEVALETNSFLTGQKILSLNYVSSDSEGEWDKEGDALVLPGSGAGLGDLPSSMAAIAHQIESIPFERIGRNLDEVLVTVKDTVGSAELKRAIVSLDAALSEARTLIREARNGMRPAFERLPRIAEKLESAVEQAEGVVGREGYGPDSTLHRNVERMTDNVAEAARSIRLLADYLSRHPEGLISGRREDSP